MPRPRIMIVDSESGQAQCLRLALKHLGLEAEAFRDPDQALAHFSPGLYAIVISDIWMSKLSGFEFARKIDAMDKDTKIILMSAYRMTREEFNKFLPSTRVDAFIKKPIGMTKLRDHLSVLLGNYKEGRWSLISSCIGSAMTTSMIFMLQDNIPVFA